MVRMPFLTLSTTLLPSSSTSFIVSMSTIAHRCISAATCPGSLPSCTNFSSFSPSSRSVKQDRRAAEDELRAIAKQSSLMLFRIIVEQVRMSEDGAESEKCVRGLLEELFGLEEEKVRLC
jgi:hypothetical protein